MRKILYLLVSLVCSLFIVSCSDDNVPKPEPTLWGKVWKLETELPLDNYYTYEAGRNMAFSTMGSGWIGWNKEDKYTVSFTYEEALDRKNTYCIYLHVKFPEFCYYLADVKVDETSASFLLFGTYEDFYQYHKNGKNTGKPVTLSLVGKYK